MEKKKYMSPSINVMDIELGNMICDWSKAVVNDDDKTDHTFDIDESHKDAGFGEIEVD